MRRGKLSSCFIQPFLVAADHRVAFWTKPKTTKPGVYAVEEGVSIQAWAGLNSSGLQGTDKDLHIKI